MSDDRGSTIPLVLGFFLLALLVVAGSVALGEAFVQQRDLQSTCDGAAAAAAASSADLDRGDTAVVGRSLRFADVDRAVADYLARDPDRADVRVTTRLAPDREQLTLTCRRRIPLTFGRLFGRGVVEHTATSSARATVLG